MDKESLETSKVENESKKRKIEVEEGVLPIYYYWFMAVILMAVIY